MWIMGCQGGYSGSEPNDQKGVDRIDHALWVIRAEDTDQICGQGRIYVSEDRMQVNTE